MFKYIVKLKNIMKNKAQVLSMDLLLGLTVFIVIFIAIFGFLNYIAADSIPIQIKEESELILSSIESQNSPLGFIENNQINKAKLDTISNPQSYENLKAVIGTKYNFCIFLEDENGNLLNLNGDIADLENDQVGIGDSSLTDADNLKINYVPCGKQGIITE